MGLANLCVDVVLEFLRYLTLDELLSFRMVCRYLNEVIVVNLLYITTVDKRISNRLLSRVLLEYINQDIALKTQVTKIRDYMRTCTSEHDRKKCSTSRCLRAISVALTTYNGREWVLQNYRTAVMPWIESWDKDNNCIPFLLAAWMGLQSIVMSALEQGIHANTSHPFLGAALHAAAYNNDTVLAKELILRGVNRRKRDGAFGDTFQLAAYRGSDQFIHTMLMADPGLRVQISQTTSTYGPFGSAFNAAAAAGHDRVVRMLLEHKAKPNILAPMQRTAMFLAARSGRANVVELLLHSGLIDPSVPDCHDISPLLAAIQGGHEPVVRLLLQIRKVKLNDTGRDGNIPAPLMVAASQGKARIVRMLLKRPDIDVNRYAQGLPSIFAAADNDHADVVSLLQCRRDIYLFTPDQSQYLLNIAVSHGQTDIVRTLLNNGHHIDPHIPDSNGQASLHIAVTKNRIEILKLLLTFPFTDPNHTDTQGRTPLMLAVLHNNHHIIHLLLQDHRTRYDITDNTNTTLLMHAIIKNNDTVFHTALNHSTDHHLNTQNTTGSTALHLACITNTTFALESLLSITTINPNLQTTQGLTPLYCAILHKSTQAIIWLLESPTISPQLPDHKGTTPLCLAIVQNNPIATDLLLSHPLVDINHPSSSPSPPTSPENQYTPLILTTITNNLPLTHHLLHHPGINPNLPDANGDTPLAHAAKHGHIAIAKALLAHPATNPHLRPQIAGGKVSAPPLVHAAENNHLEMVRLLLLSGVYPDAPDRYLRTPLIAAAERGHTEVVRELFRLGGGDVDVEHMDVRRMTALRVAARNGHEGVVRLLVMEIGVKVDLGRRSGVKLVEEVKGLGFGGVVRLLESGGGSGSGSGNGGMYGFF
ncbi:ankyrin repeat and death domain-containing protein 1A [Aspergillus tubingensis]|nr:ankyrin repeat and death domain-containing protein 1A [Aspergillus tubingensis]